MGATRRERLLGAVDPALIDALAAPEELEGLLAEREREAALALADAPTLGVDPEQFIHCLARALVTPEDVDALLAGELAVADLYLADACGRGEAAALRRFELLCGPEFDRAIGRSPALAWSTSEFRQFMAVRLLVARDGHPAKILSYRGRGSLRGWVRVTAARTIIDLSRRREQPGKENSDDGLLDHLRAGEDPELDYLRETYAPLLRGAFEQAVAALTVRQRNLLRQRYLHELPVDALAKIYAVHRSTLYVWLEHARAALLEHARHALAAGVPDERLESVIALLGSQLQVSVRRVLDSKLEMELG